MRKKLISILILCLAVAACDKDDESPDSAYSLKYYSSDISPFVIMNLEFNSGDDNIYAFGDNYYGDVSSYVVNKSDDSNYIVMLMDNSYYGDGEIFYYSANKESYELGNILITIVPIDSNKGYVNIFDYNWSTEEGKLIYKFLIDNSKSGDDRFEQILDYSGSKSIESFKYSMSENSESVEGLEKGTKDGDVYDLEEKLDNTLKFLSDPTNLYAPTALLKDFGSWLKNKGEVIYESRISPILDGVSWLWEKTSEVYEDVSEKLDSYDYGNDYEMPDNFPARVFDDSDNVPVMEEIDTGEELKDNLEEEVAEAGIVQPDECNTETQSGGYGTTITTHFLGIDPGTVYINYDMYSIPDRMEVMYNGVVVASTLGNVSYTGTLEFYFSGTVPYDYIITVIGDDTGTAWDYVAGCPQ